MVKLSYETRDAKASLAALRKEGKVPVVLYGRKHESELGAVDAKAFGKVFAQVGESQIVSLEGPSGEHEVLVHELQLDPVRDTAVHIDFLVIEKGRKVEVSVPLNFIGVAPAEKELHGNVVKIMHEVEIEAMPKDLPSHLDVDLSLLVDFSSQIHASDIALPSGVELKTSPDEVVATAEEAIEEDLSTPVEGPDLANIEVEEKGKKEEEGAEGAAEGAAPAPEAK
jgi:large subunit ribosomal protein L25